MGAPPAPPFAMLYYGAHEQFALIPTFQDSLAYYGRYIDDGLGIWICDPDLKVDPLHWESFQQHISFGKLVWDVSKRQPTFGFLDLNISLLPSGCIKTKLYKIDLNLHLYLSPLSAHPPGLLSGLVHGMLYQIILLPSDLTNILEKTSKNSSVGSPTTAISARNSFPRFTRPTRRLSVA
jgi:hypothetical protein